MGDLSADLDRIIDTDRRTFRIYLALGAGVVFAGCAVTAIGFVVPFGLEGQENIQSWPVRIGGVLIGTISAIPLKQCVDRRERLADIKMLRDKWRELMSLPQPPEDELARIREIVWKLYEKRAVR